MYAMLMEGVCKEKIWGGHHLEAYGKKMGKKKIGESWEIACHKEGVSRVKNGRYKGLSLADLLTDESHEIFLESMEKFPLLIKYIDATDNLSLQVHPDDAYSKQLNEGKTEAWYIIEAEEDAEIILGTSETSLEELRVHIEDNEEYDYVNHIPVKPGELYFVPAGTVHAIGKGIVLLEIQQNSDVTFRIYDYQRGRDLHLEEAKEVVKLDAPYRKCEGEVDVQETYTLTTYLEEPEFVIEKIEINNQFKEKNEQHDFHLVSCIEGQGMVIHEEGYTVFQKGDSLLLPAKLGSYRIAGYATLIRSYIPK